MSQINPYQGILVPSPRLQAAKPQRDRQQGRRQEEPPQSDEQEETKTEDGEERLDLKA